MRANFLIVLITTGDTTKPNNLLLGNNVGYTPRQRISSKTPFPTDIPNQTINPTRSRSEVLIKNPPINVMKTEKR